MTLKNRLALGSAALLTAFAAASPAGAATLLGSSVTASIRYPTFDTVFASTGPVVVDAAVEVPFGSLAGSSDFTIDVTDTQIIFENFHNNWYDNTDFNGFLLEFAGASAITQVTLNAASTFIPTSFAFTGDSVQFDVADRTPDIGSRMILDVNPAISAAVPEPATWAMLILGFGLVGGAMRRPRRVAVRVRYTA